MPCRELQCVSFWLLLVFACVLYSASVWVTLGHVVNFHDNLLEALSDLVGFRWLETDAAQVQLAAFEMLRKCGADPRRDCPDGLANRSLLAHDFKAHLAIINTSFDRSLASIKRFSSDRFFHWGALELAAACLNNMAMSWQSLRIGNVSCSNSTAVNCNLLFNTTQLFDGASSIQAQVMELVGSYSYEHDGFVVEFLNVVYVFHIPYVFLILPYLSFVPVAVDDLRCCRRMHRSSAGIFTACRIVFLFLLWFVFFPIVLTICIVGVDLKLDLGLLKVDFVRNKPVLATATMLRHVYLEFPIVWEHVVGEQASLGFHGLFIASIAFVLLCLWMLLRFLRRRCWKGSSREICADIFADVEGALPEDLSEIQRLRFCQIQALKHARVVSKSLHIEALPKLMTKATLLGFSEAEVNQALNWVRHHAPIVVHLDLQEVGALLMSDTHYRNQLETKTSSGTDTCAQREDWENKLFNGAYREAPPFDRCKSAALNMNNDPEGVRACNKYGLSYLVLRGVRLRTTLCDTNLAGVPTDKLATVDYCAHLFEQLPDRELREQLVTVSKISQGMPGDPSDVLMHTEAHIHGEIRLDKHVERIMVHPSLRDLNTVADVFAGLKTCRSRVLWIDENAETRRLCRGKAPAPPLTPSLPTETIKKTEELQACSSATTVRMSLPNVPLKAGSKVQFDFGGGADVEITLPEGTLPGQSVIVKCIPGAKVAEVTSASVTAGGIGSDSILIDGEGKGSTGSVSVLIDGVGKGSSGSGSALMKAGRGAVAIEGEGKGSTGSASVLIDGEGKGSSEAMDKCSADSGAVFIESEGMGKGSTGRGAVFVEDCGNDSSLCRDCDVSQYVEMFLPTYLATSWRACGGLTASRGRRTDTTSRGIGAADLTVGVCSDSADVSVGVAPAAVSRADHDAVALPPQLWEVEDGDGVWSPCALDFAIALQGAVNSSSRDVSFETGGFRYMVDLESGVLWNLDTGSTLRMRLRHFTLECNGTSVPHAVQLSRDSDSGRTC
eukprot:TRINITY_DN18733_c0_g1_i1.p1 TRINITY_DN18733_c0_g1~~TRINITY_DN18733_c0_g1_i1.p1  ORF type:complete len:1008 (-),score=172.57 TRINITY_DN18733_c0_g1_i1:4-3027(-)